MALSPPIIQDSKRTSSTDQMWMQQVVDTVTKHAFIIVSTTNTNVTLRNIDQVVLATNTSGTTALGIILPDPIFNKLITVKNIGIHTVSVIAASYGQGFTTIDGVNGYFLTPQYSSVTVVGTTDSNGIGQWFIIGKI